MSFIVAIDGPAGSGKGTVTEIVSKKLGLINIGSGAAYRCVALETIKRGIEIKQTQKIIDLLDKINIEFRIEDGKDVIYLNGENVTNNLRTKEVAKIVSQVSSIKEVRFKLNDIFRKCAYDADVIMEGRDIGTYVFPNANVKIYLDATAEERARRRFIQNQEIGVEMSYQEILENIRIRDKNDMEKEIGALKMAEDAIYVDSSNMTIEEVVKQIVDIINKKK
ncbi:MAG: (d)CMP kinase [Clostridia bacterium]|nr:(d)CMP kinase [Clostridia bacterium]